MTRHQEEPELKSTNIEAILEFLPLLEAEGFRAYSGISDGYYHWHPELERLHQALYDNNWVISFDWPEWQQEAAGILRDKSRLKEADLDTLRKLLTTLARQEHFFTNAFPIACEDGTLVCVLRRLKELNGGVGVASE